LSIERTKLQTFSTLPLDSCTYLYYYFIIVDASCHL